jgi:hypothetical protein
LCTTEHVRLSWDLLTDNGIICYADVLTSLLAGFVVFTILGNMAWRQTGLAAANPGLRETICQAKMEDWAGGLITCPDLFKGDCSMCLGDAWRTAGACCGAFTTDNVAKAGIYLAFAVCSLQLVVRLCFCFQRHLHHMHDGHSYTQQVMLCLTMATFRCTNMGTTCHGMRAEFRI